MVEQYEIKLNQAKQERKNLYVINDGDWKTLEESYAVVRTTPRLEFA